MIPPSFAQQRRFSGLDLFHSPQDCGDSSVTQADNLYVVGLDLLTRPGLSGKFTTALGAPVYAPFAYVKNDLTTEILFVCAGRLYRVASPFTTPVEVLINNTTSFSLNSPKAFICRVGRYAYIIDGAGPLYRVNLDASTAAKVATAVTGQTAPTSGAAAALSSIVLDAFSTTTNWTLDALASSTNRLDGTSGRPDGTFVAWAAPNSDGGGWHPINLDGSLDLDFVTGVDPAIPTDKYIRLDDRGDSFESLITISNAQFTGQTARWANHFRFFCNYVASYGNDGIDVTVDAFADDPGTVLIGSRSKTFTATAIGAKLNWEGVISFADVDTQILSYRVRVRAGANVHPGGNGPYIGNLQTNPVTAPVTLSITAGKLGVTATQAYDPVTAFLGGVHLSRHLASTIDFSTISHISIAVSQVATFQAPPRIKLGFRPDNLSATAFAYSNEMTLSADGTHYDVDISNMTAAARTGINYLEIVFLTDVTVTKGGTGTLMALGPLTNAGNLSVGYADYLYTFTEVQDLGADGVVESDPASYAPPLTPTGTQAQAVVTLPAGPINAATTHYYIYRRGGASDPASVLLVAKVAIGANSSGTYVSWTFGTRVFVDNTPDSQLDPTQLLITGRGAPPVGAQAICEWQGRLWLALGSTLYGSWQITSNVAALYYNAVTLPESQDPSASIKGLQVSVGGFDNDPIAALVSNGSQMVILKGRARRLLVGIDPTDFQLMDDHTHSGVGCSAPRAVELVGGLVWTLASSCVYQFQGANPVPRSVPIEPGLNPVQYGGSAIPAQYYAAAAMVYHGRRLYLFAPKSAASTLNDCAWVWDSRQDGWTRYLWPAGLGITGAASLSSATDTDDLYLAGTDGQLYQLTGNGDKATPASTAAPVAFAFSSRGFGQETSDVTYYQSNIANRVFVEATTGESTALTVGVSAKGCGSIYSQAYTFSGYKSPRMEVKHAVIGGALIVSMTGATATPTKIVSCGIEYAQGGYSV